MALWAIKVICDHLKEDISIKPILFKCLLFSHFVQQAYEILVSSPAAHALNKREGVWYTSTIFWHWGQIFDPAIKLQCTHDITD